MSKATTPGKDRSLAESGKPGFSLRALPWDVAAACLLLTRLPLPNLPDAAFARQAQSAWAFPLAGLVVAVIAGVIGETLLQMGLGPVPAAGVTVALLALLTGAMHEDGLADTADGLWGGRDPARRLEIMKDSSVGTYGVLALIFSTGLRWSALAVLLPGGIGALIAAAVLSRAVLPAVMAGLPPVRSDGLSRGVGVPGRSAVIAALFLGAAIALTATGWALMLPALAALVAVLLVAATARAKIGGQTGDILGATQQMAEIVLLLGFAALA